NLFVNGHDANAAWALITGDDRARRQRYLDAYGAENEQHALEDGVITAGANTGYMIRAFDSYWNVEAAVSHNLTWTAELIQRVHANCKLLPPGDVRSGAWTHFTLDSGTGASMSGGHAQDADWG